MYKHVAETSVTIAHAGFVAEQISEQVLIFGLSSVVTGSEKRLDFDGGRVIIKTVDEALFLHVSARELILFFAIRTLLEGCLLDYLPSTVSAIEWLPSANPPRMPISDLVGRRGTSST